MLVPMLAIIVIFAVVFLLYRYVTSRRDMEFLLNNKFLLKDEIASIAPNDMIYDGVIVQVKERKDTRIELIIQTEGGTKEAVQVEDKTAKAHYFPLREERKYMGGFYYALISQILKYKGTLVTTVVGIEKSQIYLKNKYSRQPFKIHIDHVGHIDPNWTVGKVVKVKIKDRKFYINM